MGRNSKGKQRQKQDGNPISAEQIVANVVEEFPEQRRDTQWGPPVGSGWGEKPPDDWSSRPLAQDSNDGWSSIPQIPPQNRLPTIPEQSSGNNRTSQSEVDDYTETDTNQDDTSSRRWEESKSRTPTAAPSSPLPLAHPVVSMSRAEKAALAQLELRNNPKLSTASEAARKLEREKALRNQQSIGPQPSMVSQSNFAPFGSFNPSVPKPFSSASAAAALYEGNRRQNVANNQQPPQPPGFTDPKKTTWTDNPSLFPGGRRAARIAPDPRWTMTGGNAWSNKHRATNSEAAPIQSQMFPGVPMPQMPAPAPQIPPQMHYAAQVPNMQPMQQFNQFPVPQVPQQPQQPQHLRHHSVPVQQHLPQQVGSSWQAWASQPNPNPKHNSFTGWGANISVPNQGDVWGQSNGMAQPNVQPGQMPMGGGGYQQNDSGWQDDHWEKNDNWGQNGQQNVTGNDQGWGQGTNAGGSSGQNWGQNGQQNVTENDQGWGQGTHARGSSGQNWGQNGQQNVTGNDQGWGQGTNARGSSGQNWGQNGQQNVTGNDQGWGQGTNAGGSSGQNYDSWGGQGGQQSDSEAWGGEDAWGQGQTNDKDEWAKPADTWDTAQGDWTTSGPSNDDWAIENKVTMKDAEAAGSRNVLSSQQHSQIVNALLNNSQSQKNKDPGQQHSKKSQRKRQHQSEQWGWGEDNDDKGWGSSSKDDYDDDENRRVHFSPKNSVLWSKQDAQGSMKLSLDPQRGFQMLYSQRQAFSSTSKAFWTTNARNARDRIHWKFPPDKDRRVADMLSWVRSMSLHLAEQGVVKMLETREKGAFFTNVLFRLPGYAHFPAFDWLTFNELQGTLDETLQNSVAAYNPSTTVLVFVYLPSQSGRSVAIWREKIHVPDDTRKKYQTLVGNVSKNLRKEVEYLIMVDHYSSDSQKRRSQGGLVQNFVPVKQKSSVLRSNANSTAHKKRKWWHFFFS